MDDFIKHDHEHEDDGRHIMQVEVEFFDSGEKDEEGNTEYTLGHIHTHYHAVPPGMIVDALIVIARDVVKQGMAVNMFNEAVPEAVRDIAARVMATQFMVGRIQDPDLMNSESVRADVPDDISSLLPEN